MSSLFTPQPEQAALVEFRKSALKSAWDTKFNILGNINISAVTSDAPLVIPFLQGTVISFEWFVPYQSQFKGLLKIFLWLTLIKYILDNMGDLYS